MPAIIFRFFSLCEVVVVVSYWLVSFEDCSAPVPELSEGYVETTEESTVEIRFKNTGVYFKRQFCAGFP